MIRSLFVLMVLSASLSYGQIVIASEDQSGGSTPPCSSAPTYVKFVAGQTDSTSVAENTKPVTMTFTGLLRGDLVRVVINDRAANTLTVSSNGGQVWTSETAVGTTETARSFWCTNNAAGTLTAQFTTSGTSSTIPLTVTGAVWRPCDTTHAWGVSAAEIRNTFTAPSSPFNMIAPTITTGKNNSVVVVTYASQDDNSYFPASTAKGLLWTDPQRGTQNTSGSQQCVATFYYIWATAGAVGPDTVQQTNRGGDAGVYLKQAFYDSVLALETVTLSTPSNSATGVSLNPSFAWTAGGYGFVSDQIQIDSVDNTFGALTKDSTISASTGMASFGGLTVSHTYYWRVRRTNYTGTGGWSSTFSFTTGTGSASASDDFAGTGALSGNWTTVIGSGLTRASNVLDMNSNNIDAVVYYNATTFATNHSSKLTFLTGDPSPGFSALGVAVRASTTGGGQAYFFTINGNAANNNVTIVKLTGGTTFNTLVDVYATYGTTFTNGDTFKLKATGTSTTTLSFYKNDVLIGTVDDSSSPLTTGQPGLHGWTANTTVHTTGDNWIGSDE